MATKSYKKYPGILRWCKIFRENMDLGVGDNERARKIREEFEGMWSVDLCVSDEVKNQMVSDGIKPEINGFPMFKHAGDVDDKGKVEYWYEDHPWVYKFKREHKTKFLDDSGNPIYNEPPVVVDLNNTTVTSKGNHVPNIWTYEDGLIGNGSIGVIKCMIWTSGSRSMVKLEGVGIDQCVAFERDEEVVF